MSTTGDVLQPFPTTEELHALADAAAIRPRGARYIGDTLTIRLDMLPAGDVALLRTIYDFLGELCEFVGARLERGEEAIGELEEYVAASRYADLAAGINRLGAALRADGTAEIVRKAYHDVRGGSLSALVAHLDLLELGESEPDDLARIFVLCRDHRTIMRNAVRDLDPEGYASDLEDRLCSIDLLRDKWSETRYRSRGADAVVHVECGFRGSISDCCTELAALDRVIYNLLHNASAYTADGHAYLRMLPIDDNANTHLRFVVVNRVRMFHIEALTHIFGTNLDTIFQGGFTTGGHGIGLRICADFVAHGYGLTSLDEARTRGYLGAKLIRDHFVVWFHWPARRKA